MQKVGTTLHTVNNMSRLVLSRKLDQSVVIHDGKKVITTIKVSKVSDRTVKLTFNADVSIKIDRAESYKEAK